MILQDSSLSCTGVRIKLRPDMICLRNYCFHIRMKREMGQQIPKKSWYIGTRLHSVTTQHV